LYTRIEVVQEKDVEGKPVLLVLDMLQEALSSRTKVRILVRTRKLQQRERRWTGNLLLQSTRKRLVERKSQLRKSPRRKRHTTSTVMIVAFTVPCNLGRKRRLVKTFVPSVLTSTTVALVFEQCNCINVE
jgi:Fic family protein